MSLIAHGVGQTPSSVIAEHLTTPTGLTRIPLLRQRIGKEKASLQSTLSERAKEQVVSVREGLGQLKDARNTLESLKEDIQQVEKRMNDPTSQIEGFSSLSQVSMVHSRFIQALEMVTSLRDMYSQLNYISTLLEQDAAKPTGHSPNLLTIHYHLAQLETFRNETMAKVKRANSAPEVRATLEQYFKRLGEGIEAFETHYFGLAKNLLALARKGNASVAVRIVKIALVEGSRDEKAIAIRMLKKSGNMDVASRFKSIEANARVFKHYRAKVMAAIRDGCKDLIQKSWDSQGGNMLVWLDTLDWIFDDLQTVDELLVPMFPEDWNIATVYMKGYHKALYDHLANYMKSTPEPGALMRLSQFAKDYKKTMHKELGIPEEILQPPLLDGKDKELVEDYLKIVGGKMNEWGDNLLREEMNEFKNREQPPEVDAEGYYGLQGSVILFQMVNQQIDLALDSNQGAVLARVVEEANRVMKSIQAQWMKLISGEFKLQVDKPEETPGGLVEYIMALANDQIKSADYTEALSARLEGLVSEKYRVSIVDKLNDAMDGFLDVAKKCIQVLIDVIFTDIKPVTKSLLTSNWYTNERMMAQIVITLNDYIVQDYQLHLNPDLFELFIEDFLDTFLITYLVAIRQCGKLRVPQVVERIRKDTFEIKEFLFQNKIKDQKAIEDAFEPVEAVIRLIDASRMMILLDYYPFMKAYGSNVAYVEAIMKARDDLDRSAVSEVMESIKRKAKSASESGEGNKEPTIFSRLPAK